MNDIIPIITADKDSNIIIRSYVQGPFAQNRNRNRRGKLKAKPGTDARVLQLINRSISRNRVVKYFDTFLLSTNSTTTVGYEDLTIIPQGFTQNQRVADTVWIHRIDIRGNWVQTNADEFSTVRFGFFLWWQNTASATPGSGSIYESPVIFGVYSPLNFEGREYYSMLRDYQVALSGTATNPTINSNRTLIETITFGNPHRIDFNLGINSGTGKCYFVNFSDSGATPFPIYNLQTRTWYFDE